MIRKLQTWLLMTLVIAFLLIIFSDQILGPVVGTQFDGKRSGALLLSKYSVDVLVYLATSYKVALASPAEFYATIRSSQLLWNLLERMTLIAVMSASLAWAFAFLGNKKKKTNRHISGMQLLSGKETLKNAKLQFRKEARGKRQRHIPTIYLAPNMPITPDQETRGFLIEGGIGSGKTVIIESLLSQAIKRRDKVVLYDIKGDFAPKIQNRLVLNPFAAETTVWAVARDVSNADQARQLARMLLPSDKGSDTFWDNAAHTILSGILISLQVEHPRRWTFRDVWHLVLSPREIVIAKLKAHYPPAAVFFAEKAGASNLEQGVLATLSARLSPYIEPLAIAWGNSDDQAAGFSFEAWLFSDDMEPRTLILQGSPEHSDAAAAWIRMAVNYLAGLLVSPRIENDGPLRLWLIIDELHSLGSIPRLTDIVDRGRQKGVRSLIACQSLAQIALDYGEWAQSAETTFGTRIFGKMSPGERTQAIIRSLGEQNIEITSVTTTFNADGSTSRTERLGSERLPVLTPEVFGTLGKQGEIGIDALIVGLTPNVLRAHWPFPPKQADFHPPFKLAALDRSVLQTPSTAPKREKKGVAKSFGLKLDQALDGFDAEKPTRTK